MIHAVNEMDFGVISFIGAMNDAGMVQAPWLIRLLGGAAGLVLGGSLIKMGPLVLLLSCTWLRRAGSGPGITADPQGVLRGMLAVFLSLAAGRLLQQALPMRLRPRFVRPDAFIANDNPFVLQEQDWSSLPSDHAALVVALVVVTWWGSRHLGLLAALWGAFYICLPRIYYGLHYLSDIVSGAALGGIVTLAVLRMPLPAALPGRLDRLAARMPVVLMLGIFLFGWEVIELFETLRRLGAGFGKAAALLAGHPGGT